MQAAYWRSECCRLKIISKSSQASNLKAFTLVEFLVVIGIVAVLAALIIPVVGKVRASAEGANCASNLRQLGMAVSLMISEQSPKLSIHYYDGSKESTWSSDLVEKGYLTSDEMKQCARCPSLDTPEQHIDNHKFFCYGLNRLATLTQVSDWSANPPVLWDKKINTLVLPNPTKTIIMGDSVLRPSWDNAYQWLFFGIGNTGDGGIIHARHSGRANLFFLDGHVQALTPEEIRALQTSNPEIYSQGVFEYAEEAIGSNGKASIKTIQ